MDVWAIHTPFHTAVPPVLNLLFIFLCVGGTTGKKLQIICLKKFANYMSEEISDYMSKEISDYVSEVICKSFILKNLANYMSEKIEIYVSRKTGKYVWKNRQNICMSKEI